MESGLMLFLERAPAAFYAELRALLLDPSLYTWLAETFLLLGILRLGLPWPAGGSGEYC